MTSKARVRTITSPPQLRHYTVLSYLPQILKDQELWPATAGVAATERPAVWFTTRPTWEPTANKLWRTTDGRLISLTTEQTEIQGGGLIRFEINPEAAPFTWADHIRKSGISKTMARALERVGRRDGSDPDEWRVSYAPVRSKHWLALEIWHDGRWRDAVELHESVQNHQRPVDSPAGEIALISR